MNKRYLVTGGCGFIGSHVVDSLIADGHDVVVLDDLSSGKRENLSPHARLVVGSVADPVAVADALRGTSGCFHLAAVASVAKSITDWVGTHRANQTGTVCVLNAATTAGDNGPVPVVYASSAAVYGDAAASPIDESFPLRPLTAYGADKLGSELHAAVAWNAHAVPTTGLRFFNVYGPRQDPSSPYSGVISIFVDRLKAGQPITIYGDGTQVRDFVHVADVVDHLRQAMRTCNEGARLFNVCTGRPTSISQLVQLIAAILQREPKVQYAPWRKGDIRLSVGSPAGAIEALGLRAKTELSLGLRHLLEASAGSSR